MTDINLSPKTSRKRRSLRLCTSSITDKQECSESPITTIQDLTVNAQQKNIATTPKDTNNKPPGNSMPHHGNNHHFLPPPPNLYPLRHNIMPTNNQPRFMHPMHSPHPMPPHIQHHLSSHRPSQLSTSGMLPNLPCHPPINQTPQPPSIQLPTTTPPPATPIFQSQPEPQRCFGPNPPPITILVPYPIIMPIPIPIPIPMPIVHFLRAAQAKLDEKKNTENNNNTKASDEPLDFTTSKEGNVERGERTSTPPEIPSPVEEAEAHKITLSQCAEQHQSNKISHQIVSEQNEFDDEDSPQKQQRLPKFKITRLNSKRIITSSAAGSSQETHASVDAAQAQTSSSLCIKESPAETSRPLRKRKRIVDCDYLRG